jgi:hypothetical protein
VNLKSFSVFMLISLISACSDGMSDSEDKISEASEDMTTEEVQLRECASSHAMVGQTGELSTLAHSVSGTATIVDDCTIEITNFNYDGGGIIVEVYAGVDENYHPPAGFAISENIFGTRFVNQTYTVQLPTDKTLDDLNGISIWCSDVGVSFGDSLFN